MIVTKTQFSQVGDNWRDKKRLNHALKKFAGIMGFIIRQSHSIMECDRAGIPSAGRKFAKGNLKCGCQFRITFRPSCHEVKEEPTRRQSRPVFDDNVYVTISKVNLDHTNGCVPSPQQQVMTKCRSGRYVSNLFQMALYQLCNSSIGGKSG